MILSVRFNFIFKPVVYDDVNGHRALTSRRAQSRRVSTRAEHRIRGVCQPRGGSNRRNELSKVYTTPRAREAEGYYCLRFAFFSFPRSTAHGSRAPYTIPPRRFYRAERTRLPGKRSQPQRPLSSGRRIIHVPPPPKIITILREPRRRVALG